VTLLQTGTVATDRKSLCPRASDPLLLKRRYSGSLLVTGRRCLLLLYLIVHSSDGLTDVSSPVTAR
jgi:hypothetical protein